MRKHFGLAQRQKVCIICRCNCIYTCVSRERREWWRCLFAPTPYPEIWFFSAKTVSSLVNLIICKCTKRCRFECIFYNPRCERMRKKGEQKVGGVLTASVCIGWTANNMVATKLDNSGKNMEHILKIYKQYCITYYKPTFTCMINY